MTYSSSLTDKEWEIIEPLLPKKQKTRPPTWTKRQILDGVFYQLKNGVIGAICPKTCRPTPQCSGITNTGVQRVSSTRFSRRCIHRYENAPKKTALDAIANHRLTSCKKYVQCRDWIQRILSLQMHQWHQATSRHWYFGVAVLYPLHESKCLWRPGVNWTVESPSGLLSG